MPLASDRLNYLLAFQAAIVEAGGHAPDSLYKNFFYRNAIAFLNSAARLKKGRSPPGAATKPPPPPRTQPRPTSRPHPDRRRQQHFHHASMIT